MEQLAGVFGQMTTSRQQPAIVVSQPSPELTDRMYADLIESLKHSREIAERHAAEAERRAQAAENRLQEFMSRIHQNMQ